MSWFCRMKIVEIDRRAGLDCGFHTIGHSQLVTVFVAILDIVLFTRSKIFDREYGNLTQQWAFSVVGSEIHDREHDNLSSLQASSIVDYGMDVYFSVIECYHNVLAMGCTAITVFVKYGELDDYMDYCSSIDNIAMCEDLQWDTKEFGASQLVSQN